MKFHYQIGPVSIQSEDIVALKNLAQQLKEMDLPKGFHDVIFAIDCDYQRWFELDEDDWNIHEEMH